MIKNKQQKFTYFPDSKIAYVFSLLIIIDYTVFFNTDCYCESLGKIIWYYIC